MRLPCTPASRARPGPTAAALVTLVVLAAAACTGAAGAPPAPAAPIPHVAPASSWTTFDQNGMRTGVDASGASFSPASPAWTSPTLDGAVYGLSLIHI